MSSYRNVETKVVKAVRALQELDLSHYPRFTVSIDCLPSSFAGGRLPPLDFAVYLRALERDERAATAQLQAEVEATLVQLAAAVPERELAVHFYLQSVQAKALKWGCAVLFGEER
jgi:hypothetical protein